MSRLFGKIMAHGQASNASITKAVDQTLLMQYLWPMAKYDMVNHDSYLCEKFNGNYLMLAYEREKRRNFSEFDIRICRHIFILFCRRGNPTLANGEVA